MSLFWQETLILAFVAHTSQLSGKSMLGHKQSTREALHLIPSET